MNRLESVGAEAPSFWSRIPQVVLGPWPLRPALLWIMTLVVFQYASATELAGTESSLFRASRDIPVNLALATLMVAPLGIIKLVHRRVTGTDALTRKGYLGAVLFTGVWAGSVRFITSGEPLAENGDSLAYYLVRSIIFVVALHSVLGVSDARLRGQIRRADEATALVVSQRAAVLQAEERARRTVAGFLHDRVQAGLVSIMLQLRLVQRQTDEATAAHLGAVIEDMERMRVEDVRSASRQLSPDLESTGLDHALGDLAATYAPGMQVTIDQAVTDAGWRRLSGGAADGRLAAYRIVEQGLLNAAAHGHANVVRVDVRETPAELVIAVRDDGRGLPSDGWVRGSGTAIIDSWIGSLQGSWVLERRGSETVLEAVLPARHSHE